MNDESLTYEQCPFERTHVERLYPIIPNLEEDGNWHAFSSGSAVSTYRIWSRSIFQAVYCDQESDLLAEVKRSLPPQSEEDSKWLLIKHVDDEFYSVGSIFTETFGPFRGLDDVNDFLQPYALRLGEYDGRTRGFADFAELENGCWLDAMERLRFVESLCLEANRSVEELLGTIWNRWKDLLITQASQPESGDDIVSLPQAVPRSGPKRREPLPRLSLSQNRIDQSLLN